jgi:dinuclear metal center YbgI/SA1388 family protein
MTTKELDQFFRSELDIEGFAAVDSSLNGLQADNDGGDIRRLAFGVDAALETIERAAACGAGLLFVHHGLFWGQPLAVCGPHRRRLKALLDHNLALYAVHLPLDQHPVLGNNAALAELLGLKDLEPFGDYHGKTIGWKGVLAEPLTVKEAEERIRFHGGPALGVFPFGPEKSRTCAIISGGAAQQGAQAVREGVDLFVTGESSHGLYHTALEGGLNVVAGGHYATETWGVRRVMERCKTRLGLDCEFIDFPTGL